MLLIRETAEYLDDTDAVFFKYNREDDDLCRKLRNNAGIDFYILLVGNFNNLWRFRFGNFTNNAFTNHYVFGQLFLVQAKWTS